MHFEHVSEQLYGLYQENRGLSSANLTESNEFEDSFWVAVFKMFVLATNLKQDEPLNMLKCKLI
jgi:hypothetical protein